MSKATEILGGLSASNLFNLQGVVAVVTGGGTGIGLMITSTLIANGAKVYIIGPEQNELDRIAKVYNDGAKQGMGRIQGIQGDIRRKAEATRLAALINDLEPISGVTVLFNNAGILHGTFQRPPATTSSSPITADTFVKALFDPIEEETFTDVYHTNAVGPYWLTVAFLPLLERWKEEDAATSGFSFPYMFSKSAIGHATSSLAHELLPLGIRVNGIAPGYFPTEMTNPGSKDESGVSGTVSAEEKFGFRVPVNPLGGTRRDMGALALFLVANWFVNGETVLIDGGTLLDHPSSY